MLEASQLRSLVNERDLLTGNRDRLFRIVFPVLFSIGAGDLRNVATRYEHGHDGLLLPSTFTCAPDANTWNCHHHHLAYS